MSCETSDSTVLKILEYTPSERVLVHMHRAGQRLHLARLLSTTVAGGLLVVREMSICFTSEQEISMSVVFSAEWMFCLRNLVQAAQTLSTVGDKVWNLRVVLSMSLMLNGHKTSLHIKFPFHLKLVLVT
jgi:hypothetical protein